MWKNKLQLPSLDTALISALNHTILRFYTFMMILILARKVNSLEITFFMTKQNKPCNIHYCIVFQA